MSEQGLYARWMAGEDIECDHPGSIPRVSFGSCLCDACWTQASDERDAVQSRKPALTWMRSKMDAGTSEGTSQAPGAASGSVKGKRSTSHAPRAANPKTPLPEP